MNTASRTITGILLIIAGLGLSLLPLFIIDSWPSLFFGIPLLIIGLFVLFNKNEDIIEERKDEKNFRDGNSYAFPPSSKKGSRSSGGNERGLRRK